MFEEIQNTSKLIQLQPITAAIPNTSSIGMAVLYRAHHERAIQNR